MTIPEFPSAWLPLADNVVKATIVLVAAAVATRVLRRSSAALRHLIWTVALLSALLMPVLSMGLPRWQFPVITISTSERVAGAVEAKSVTPPPIRRDAADRSADRSIVQPASTSVAESAIAVSRGSLAWLSEISWERALFMIWTVGALLIVGRVLVGLLVVQWMARSGHRVLDAPWMKMAVQLASEVGVSPTITFVRSGRTAMPMACGVLRPAVMMPEEADEWPAERLRIVLLHELAHVKRRDCLTHLVAQLSCALHWFNPLAWIAARHARTERERACDDLVLAAGTRGPDYADQLLEIARVIRSGRYPAMLAGATLAMAHRSQLEGRLMAILDPRVPHAALTRLRAAAATTLCCAAVVPLAALQPWEQQSAPSAPAVNIASTPSQVQIPEPTPSPAPLTTPAPVATTTTRGRSVREGQSSGSIADATIAGTVHGTVAGTLSGTTHGTIQGILGGSFGIPHEKAFEVPHEVWREGAAQDSKSTSSKADPRMVAALTAALKDTDKEVRETAMHALVQMRDPAIFEPLLQALKDASAEVRQQAAFGLGQLRDRRAVEPLSGALKDENPQVRQQAAFALSQLRDRSAIAALTGALKDADAEVRQQVIFALGQMRDPAAIEAFTIALRDSNAEVRQQAAFALGQLRDRRSLEPLISALKDTDAEVREQAAFALGQLRDRGAVEALVIALKDSSASVREQVAFALGQLRDPRAIDGLTAALKDPQATVRQQAAFALGQLAR